jgi:hypothetical protein
MFLLSSILQYGPVFESPVVEVKRHAPAATPHAAVLLDQPIKIRPGSFVQRLGVEAIHEMLENRMSLSADAEVARRQSGGTWLWVIDQFSIFHLSQASRIPESKVAPSQ